MNTCQMGKLSNKEIEMHTQMNYMEGINFLLRGILNNSIHTYTHMTSVWLTNNPLSEVGKTLLMVN